MEAFFDLFPGKYTQLVGQVVRAGKVIVSMNRADVKETMGFIHFFSCLAVVLTIVVRIKKFPEYMMLEVLGTALQQAAQMYNLRCTKALLDIPEIFSQWMLAENSDYLHLVPIVTNLTINFLIAVWAPSLCQVGTLLGYVFEWLVSQVNAHVLWKYLLCETNDGWPWIWQLGLHVFSIGLIDAGSWNPWTSLFDAWTILQDAFSSRGTCPVDVVDCAPRTLGPAVFSALSEDFWYCVAGCIGLILFFGTRPHPGEEQRHERIERRSMDQGYKMLAQEVALQVPAPASLDTEPASSGEAVDDAAASQDRFRIPDSMIEVAQFLFPQVNLAVTGARNAGKVAKFVDTFIAGLGKKNFEQPASLVDTRLMQLILLLRDVDLKKLALGCSCAVVLLYGYFGFAQPIVDCIKNAGPEGQLVLGVAALMIAMVVLLDFLLGLSRFFSKEGELRKSSPGQAKLEQPAAPGSGTTSSDPLRTDSNPEEETVSTTADDGCTPVSCPRSTLRAYNRPTMAISRLSAAGPGVSCSAKLEYHGSAVVVEIILFKPEHISRVWACGRKVWAALAGPESKIGNCEYVGIKDADHDLYLTMEKGKLPSWEAWKPGDEDTARPAEEPAAASAVDVVKSSVTSAASTAFGSLASVWDHATAGSSLEPAGAALSSYASSFTTSVGSMVASASTYCGGGGGDSGEETEETLPWTRLIWVREAFSGRNGDFVTYCNLETGEYLKFATAESTEDKWVERTF